MAFCRKCGSELTDGQLFCTKCGEPVGTMNNTTAEAQTTAAPAPEAAPVEKGKLNVGMLVWSIINIICCGAIFGIIALVFTIMADNQPIEKSNSNLKIAKILNIVGTILGVLVLVIYILFFILVTVGAISSSMYY